MLQVLVGSIDQSGRRLKLSLNWLIKRSGTNSASNSEKMSTLCSNLSPSMFGLHSRRVGYLAGRNHSVRSPLILRIQAIHRRASEYR